MAFRQQLVPQYGDRVEIRPQDEYGLLDLDELLGTPVEDAAVYCCGPEPLLAAVEQRCEPWPAGALHVERFSARPVDPGMESHPFELVLERSGQRLTVPPERSALEVLEEAGIPVANACREGVCGSCLTRVLSGTPDHRDSLTDRARTDVVMPCVSRAKSAELVVDL
jgi:ferredoxin